MKVQEGLDSRIVTELVERYGAHTIILYGSRARGDATVESDVDVAAYADVDATIQDARPWEGTYLDAFVYPSARAQARDPGETELLKLVGGRALLDERDLAGPLLSWLETVSAAGPPPLTEPEARLRRVWPRKMLARIERGDVEAHYRWHWLLYQILEDHFALRGRFYPGPKRAFQMLALETPALHAAFAAALAPGADLAASRRLVDMVVGGDQEGAPLDGDASGT